MTKSGLGRPIVWSVPSNRFAVLAALAVAVAFVALDALVELDLPGFFATFFALFLSWAVGRELDPDRPDTAAMGLIVTAVLLASIGTPSLAGVLGVLLVVRLIAGTVGAKPRYPDVMFVGLLAGYLGYRGLWVIGLALGVGLVTAGARWWVGAMVGGLGAAGALFAAPLPAGSGWEVTLAGLVGIVALLASPPSSAVGDLDREPLKPGRVTIARLTAGLLLVVVTWQYGQALLAPVAGAAIGGGLSEIVRRVQAAGR